MIFYLHLVDFITLKYKTAYIIPIKRRTVGVSRAVKIPFSVIPKLAKAPYLLLYAIAVDAPTA